MNFDWSHYLLLARQLNGETITVDLSDARNRSAVSRAYYAAYNLVRQCLINKCRVNFNGDDAKLVKDKMGWGDHEITASVLEACPDINVKVSGTSLRTLKGKRVDADYDGAVANPNAKEVGDAIKLAKKVVTLILPLYEDKTSVTINDLRSRIGV